MQASIKRQRKNLPTTDLWQVGIVHQPLHTLNSQQALLKAKITWLPEPRDFRFIADPFAVRRDNALTVFVEALDYRNKRGEIHYYRYNDAYQLLDQGVALATPHHLSYPFLIEDNDEIYMLPEQYQSGKLTLYRAVEFPHRWEEVATLMNIPVIDASVIHLAGKWWMFYTLPGDNKRQLRELHVAYADTLMGPWQQHPANPVRTGFESSRPGGSPFVHAGGLYLPTQDCRKAYGDAITLLRIDTLSETAFAATPVTHLLPDGIHWAYADGLHTLSACGDVTLIDLKRVDYSRRRRRINLLRKLQRLLPI